MFEFRTTDSISMNDMKRYLAELNGSYKRLSETYCKCDEKTLRDREYYSGRIDGLLSAINCLTDGQILPIIDYSANKYEIMVKMKFDKD